MLKYWLGSAALLVVGIAMGAAADDQKVVHSKLPVGVTLQKTDAGSVLADDKGFTVYTFDKDKAPGASACNGNCAKAWPPLLASAGAPAKQPAGWDEITREDGTKQLTYKGKPLYRFDKWDTKPGDTKGNNVGGIWHVVAP